MFSQLKARWEQLGHHSRHVLINCCLGIGVLTLVHVAQGWGLFAGQVDRGFDTMLRLQAGQDRETVPPFVFIDIDGDTHLAWGEPVVTPREKLATLLEYVLGSDARAVLLDIDLSLPVDNSAVQEVLAAVAASEEASPPLVLMKTSREPAATDPGHYLELKPSTLDELVAGTPDFHWATPLFDTDRDFVLRRWKQWVPACREGKPVLLPSAQLLMISLDSDPTAEDLYGDAGSITPHSCEGWADLSGQTLSGTVKAGPHDIYWSSDDLRRLVLFNLPWVPTSEMPDTRVERDGKPVTVKAVTTIPARLITEADSLPENSLLADHFVIIGSSSYYSGDLHPTPLGLMPGSLVVINAIESLYAFGEVKAPSLWIIILVELGMLAATSLLFTHYTPGVAAFLSTVFVFGVIFPLSSLLFNNGVWLNFTLPVVAVQLHELIAIAETKFKSRQEMLRAQHAEENV
ncbi:hypothetical protein A3709_11935 [Halioglobus sp. HI00S01]|uniref:CHASE2 domain-containing protein n=2 Tax=Halioglobus sp. HI00S01 TaxID=1822214 RepID=UPI0007C25FF9|nr:CHASE2 domain-containing protein [Halioglobus sp. HI00S01]KZX60294.1 hypothetical protein A3709_11935 [Halioglobus sp. HI00S01]